MTTMSTLWIARKERTPKTPFADWLAKSVFNEVLVILVGIWLMATVGMAVACWLIDLTN